MKKYKPGTKLFIKRNEGEYVEPYMATGKTITIIKSTKYPTAYNIKEHGSDAGWDIEYIENLDFFVPIFIPDWKEFVDGT